jgi:hypothetical protein
VLMLHHHQTAHHLEYKPYSCEHDRVTYHEYTVESWAATCVSIHTQLSCSVNMVTCKSMVHALHIISHCDNCTAAVHANLDQALIHTLYVLTLLMQAIPLFITLQPDSRMFTKAVSCVSPHHEEASVALFTAHYRVCSRSCSVPILSLSARSCDKESL